MSETNTLTVKMAYDESSEGLYRTLKDIMDQKYPDIVFEGYAEDSLKERKKAFGLKGCYAARLVPFAAVSTITESEEEKEEKPMKAFYSEVSECTIDNILTFIDSIVTI